MKKVELMYFYGDDLIFNHRVEEYNGGDLPQNATLEAPRGYEPITFDKSTGKWDGGISEEEYLKANPMPTPEPTAQDKINATNFKSILDQSIAIENIEKQLADKKVAIKLSYANPLADSDMFEQIKLYFVMGLIDETYLEKSVSQNLISEREKQQILEL